MLNVAQNRPATQSSICSSSTYDNKEQEAGIANSGGVDTRRYCHTDTELRPWWQVELDKAYDIERVVIRNRTDAKGRLKNFSLLRSLDGVNWFELFRKADDTEFDVFTATISEPRPSRFVRLRLDGWNCLHIRACEVFGALSHPEQARELQARESAAQRRRAAPEGKIGHTAVIGGFDVFVDDGFSERIRRSLDSGGYEGREREIVAKLLKPTDRVLEAGTAVGVVSMTAASIVGENSVVTYEANPAMVEAARDNFRRNGFEGLRVNLGVLSNRTLFGAGKKVPFYVFRDFWASRLGAGAEDIDVVATIEVPTVCLEDEISKHEANVIICDIEGGEIELFDGADIAGIRLIIVEKHNGFVGEAATDSMIRNFILQGFSLHPAETPQHVVMVRR
jgi:FkbM family methyltransferase